MHNTEHFFMRLSNGNISTNSWLLLFGCSFYWSLPRPTIKIQIKSDWSGRCQQANAFWFCGKPTILSEMTKFAGQHPLKIVRKCMLKRSENYFSPMQYGSLYYLLMASKSRFFLHALLMRINWLPIIKRRRTLHCIEYRGNSCSLEIEF